MELKDLRVRNVSADTIEAFRLKASERGYHRQTGKAVTEALQCWIDKGEKKDGDQ